MSWHDALQAGPMTALRVLDGRDPTWEADDFVALQQDAQSEGVVSIAFGVSSAVDIVRLMVLRSGREGQTFGCADSR